MIGDTPASQRCRAAISWGRSNCAGSRKKLGIIATTSLVTALGLAAPATAAPSATCGGTGSSTTTTGTFADGSTFKIECPAGAWNGTLYLWSHGYTAPGSPNPAYDASDPITGTWLLDQGYALAGSSYSSTGWAIQDAFRDQIHTLDHFGAMYGTPGHTIAWGASLGGIITAGLIQNHPDRFDAAMPLCGVLGGGVGVWNTILDAAFAFQQLIAPDVQIVNITDPAGNLARAEAATAAAQQTPGGRARLALVAALADVPGWFTPLSPEPSPNAFAAQQRRQFQWLSLVDFPFAFALRAELEGRAGGNPSWNTGVNYVGQLQKSAYNREVANLYRNAGLDLSVDLTILDKAPRVTADRPAVGYLKKYISFNGDISVPVLTMHTTGDGLVVPQHEQAYRKIVERKGNGALLRQLYLHRAGHCAFTPAELVTGLKTLRNRMNSGSWHVGSPAVLNRRAAALGPQYNLYVVGGTVMPTAPQFTAYAPSRFPRPTYLGH